MLLLLLLAMPRPGLAAGEGTGQPDAPGVLTQGGMDAPANDDAERRFREQRRIDGRLDTLDRQLERYERERLRPAPPPGTTEPFRRGGDEPMQQRLELERRDLQWRQRQLDRGLRQPPLDRSIGGDGRLGR